MHSSRTRLRVGAAQLLRHVGLVLAEKLGVQADVAGGVDTVNVTAGVVSARGLAFTVSQDCLPEAGGDGEVVGDRAEGLLAARELACCL